METLAGKRVLITGAARGLGRALALRFAREKSRLVLVDCDGPGLNETAAIVRRLDKANTVSTFVCDLTNPTQISELVTVVRYEIGGLDVLLNNAGVAWYGSASQMTAAEWDRVMAVNLLAPIQLIREFLPDLQAQPEAHILNVSSVYGLVATNRATAYHCSKFALVGLSESLRAECDRNGLGVTVLCPGFMPTDLFGAAADGKTDRRPPACLDLHDHRESRRQSGSRHPQGPSNGRRLAAGSRALRIAASFSGAAGFALPDRAAQKNEEASGVLVRAARCVARRRTD